jgi:two-component system invasion response regulator UvrY
MARSLDKKQRLKVLVVDNHAIVRKGVRQIIDDAFPGSAIGEAANVQEALALVEKKEWDLILLDITMPGRDGLDALKDIKQRRPRVPVLFLSIHPEDQFAVRTMRAGAAGYMTKETAPEELVKAIEKVLAGGKYVSASFAERLAAGLAVPDSKLPHEVLSDREYEVMLKIAHGRTVKEIASELSLGVKTISTYRAHILRKMHLHNNAAIIRYALRTELVA